MDTTTAQDAYETDFAAWAEAQAALVAAGDWSRVDAENVSEELAALAASDKREIRSRLTVLLEHAMKLRAMPTHEAANGWRATVREQRHGIYDLISQSPSLVMEVAASLQIAYRRAWADVHEDWGIEPSYGLDEAIQDAMHVFVDVEGPTGQSKKAQSSFLHRVSSLVDDVR